MLHEDGAEPPPPVLVAFLVLPVPIRELHVNLFLMGNYLLFGLFHVSFFFFFLAARWVGRLRGREEGRRREGQC